LAAKTTASAGEVWAICVVAVSCLAFWLSMVTWADRHPIWRGRQVPEMPGPVLGGMHVAGGGRSVAPNRAAPATLIGDDTADGEPLTAAPGTGATVTAGRPRVPGPRGARPTEPEPAGSQAAGSQAAGSWAAGQAGAVPEMPAQRTGGADRPEHSVTGSGAASQDEESLGGYWLLRGGEVY
jgi:hypothetical protein